jgi:zinc transport system substrate-binding protein
MPTVPVMTRALGLLAACGALATLAAAPRDGAAAPSVVVTVGPVHSLAAGVAQGVAAPRLLLDAGISPHAYVLRPSDARALQDADLVVWVGPELERFLVRSLAAPAPGRRILELASAPGVRVLPARDAGRFDTSGSDAHQGHEHDHGRHGDPHLWLDPVNAAAIVRAVRDQLTALDPDNAPRYRANAAAVGTRIAALDRELAARLAAVRERPYLVFHDAYQGFERHYGLHPLGAVTVSPGRPPGAARLRALRAAITESGARCVFREPQFEPRLARTVAEGTGARLAVLDPLGADVEPGPEAWFTVMRRLADALLACLARE